MFDNLATNSNNQKQGQGSTQKPQPFNSVLNQTENADVETKQNSPIPPVPPIPQNQVSQSRSASPVEDMFSETDKQEKPAIFQAKTTPASMNQAEGLMPSQIDPYTGEQIKAKNKTIVFALMLISLMLVAMLGWYAYRVFFRSIVPEAVPSVITPVVNTPVDKTSPVQDTPVDLPVNNSNKQEAEQTKDSDGDGLSDAEERSLGTNPLEVDSDGDGLFDKEEVKFYKTDPLDTDTDKDGYADGIEVKGGYNPNGPGRLYNTKK